MTQLLINKFIKNKENIYDRKVRTAYGNLAGIVGIICNVLLFAGKFIVGTLFGSVSISADAINNLSDASSNIVSLVGFKLGSKPADDEHPYGHARYEYISGLMVSVMIMVIGIELLRSSFGKMINPTAVEFSWIGIVVLVASICVKLWMAFFNKKIGKIITSETLVATAADSRNDVLTTTAVLIATIITFFTGFNRLDGIMGCLVALFILYSGIGLVRDTLNPILGAAPDPELVEKINDRVMSYPGVLGLHDLMIHDYGPGNRIASFHIEMSADSDIMKSHDLIDQIEKDFLREFDFNVTIHFDPVVTSDPHVAELKTFLTQAAHDFDPRTRIHDLRIVPGNTHTNVVFECVVPSEYLNKRSQKSGELLNALRTAITEKWPDHFCVVQIETEYGAH